MDFEKLDVGCGASPKGDVNVDLYVGYTPHTGDQVNSETFQKIEPKKINNFVRADGCHLPFRDCSFNEVFSSHLIEHVVNPFVLVKEMVRVVKYEKVIVIRCPHKFARGAKELRHHVSKLDEKWFRDVARRLRLTILSMDVTWMPIGFKLGFIHVRPIAKPWEIILSMRRSNITEEKV